MEAEVTPLGTGRVYDRVYDNAEVFDIETNDLVSPNCVHMAASIDGRGYTKRYYHLHQSETEADSFDGVLQDAKYVVGHNIINYDLPVLRDLAGIFVPRHKVIDTLILSQLFHYKHTGGHSLEAWGERLRHKKVGVGITDFSELTTELESRCISDITLGQKVLERFSKYIDDPVWHPAIELEHEIAYICREMSETGFRFDMGKAMQMQVTLQRKLAPINDMLQRAFPPFPVPLREIHPRFTKTGKIHKGDFRGYDGDPTEIFWGPFTLIEFYPFNPDSPKQVVSRLNKAGWKPTEMTKGHLDARKKWNQLEPARRKYYEEFGWKICEENLKTLPADAPEGASLIAQRLILQSRLSDLNEWIALAQKTPKGYYVHGEFRSIGAWSHRLSHAKPNLANVPVAKRTPNDNEFMQFINNINDDMRGLWLPRKGYVLVGTDADGLQMRIFAHYVNDRTLTDALTKGSKADKTDIHSVHQRALGEVCASRDVAKTFIYAFLLGAGIRKIAEILSCSIEQAKTAVDNFLNFYPGLAHLKKTVIPRDAERGYFVGLDGRKVVCDSEHHMLAGYLQNGEAVIMKRACVRWRQKLIEANVPFDMHTWPHDEWQVGVPDDKDIIEFVQQTQIQAIRDQADELNMNCPLEGSSSWGYSWKDTH